MAEVGYYIFC